MVNPTVLVYPTDFNMYEGALVDVVSSVGTSPTPPSGFGTKCIKAYASAVTSPPYTSRWWRLEINKAGFTNIINGAIQAVWYFGAVSSMNWNTNYLLRWDFLAHDGYIIDFDQYSQRLVISRAVNGVNYTLYKEIYSLFTQQTWYQLKAEIYNDANNDVIINIYRNLTITSQVSGQPQWDTLLVSCKDYGQMTYKKTTGGNLGFGNAWFGMTGAANYVAFDEVYITNADVSQALATDACWTYEYDFVDVTTDDNVYWNYEAGWET